MAGGFPWWSQWLNWIYCRPHYKKVALLGKKCGGRGVLVFEQGAFYVLLLNMFSAQCQALLKLPDLS